MSRFHQVSVAGFSLHEFILGGLAFRDVADQAGVEQAVIGMHGADSQGDIEILTASAAAHDLMFTVVFTECPDIQFRQQPGDGLMVDIVVTVSKQRFCGRVKGFHLALAINDDNTLGGIFDNGVNIGLLVTQAAEQSAQHLHQ